MPRYASRSVSTDSIRASRSRAKIAIRPRRGSTSSDAHGSVAAAEAARSPTGARGRRRCRSRPTRSQPGEPASSIPLRGGRRTRRNRTRTGRRARPDRSSSRPSRGRWPRQGTGRARAPPCTSSPPRGGRPGSDGPRRPGSRHPCCDGRDRHESRRCAADRSGGPCAGCQFTRERTSRRVRRTLLLRTTAEARRGSARCMRCIGTTSAGGR